MMDGHQHGENGPKADCCHHGGPPREPVELRMCMGETWKFNKMVDRISSHIHKCQRYMAPEMNHCLKCDDKICDYFGWYYCHYHHCSAKYRDEGVGTSCPICQTFVCWIHSHAIRCTYQAECILSICGQVKKQWLRHTLKKQFSTDTTLTKIMTPSSPGNHTLNSRRRSDGLSSSPESSVTLEVIGTNEFDQQNDFGVETQPIRSGLTRQPTVVDQSNQSSIGGFGRTTSGGSTESLKQAHAAVLRRARQTRGDSSDSVSSGEDPGDRWQMRRSKSADRNSQDESGYGIMDHGSSTVEPVQRMHSGEQSKVVVGDDSFQTQKYLTMIQGGSRTDSMSSYSQSPSSMSSDLDPGMESLSEGSGGLPSPTDEMSTLTGTDPSTSGLDSIPTPTTAQTGFPPRPTDLISREHVSAVMATVDAVRDQHRGQIEKMKGWGRMMKQQPPTGRAKKEDAIGAPIMDGIDLDGDLLPKEHQEILDRFEKPFAAGHENQCEEVLSKPFEEREEVIEEEMAYRDSIKQYLQGQFYHHQVYREGRHWDRLWRIGTGGQSTCYTIADKQTNSLLALKEGGETDKTVDEAYICLKLSCLTKYEPPNIVEYFGAAMLPYSPQRGLVQLFLELMPMCMQGYIFKNGPICSENVHNYASQLFEAVEFLHNKLKIVHCDIKPANVLVDYNQQRLKVADFGCAELLEECHLGPCFRGNEKAGTLAYNPPEYYSEQRCSFAFDIWQAGCTVLAMLTGKRPWRNLFMDCADPLGKAHPRVIKMKGQYRNMISQQTVHMLPSFVGDSLQQLLFGCIHSDYSHRLSAQDCTYLLANAEAKTIEQRQKVLEAFGHSRSHDVLLNFSPPPPSLDVYLGSPHEARICDLQHVLQGGWLGTVLYHEGMTYRDVRHRISTASFPVSQYFGDYQLAISENQPQGIWRTTNGYPGGVNFVPISEHSPVDRNKAVIIQLVM